MADPAMRKCIILNIFSLSAVLIILLLGTFYKHIPFGYGLGDMFYYAGMLIMILIHSIILLVFFILKYKKKECNVLRRAYTLLMLLIAIYFWLKATIWRGPEYGWKGSLFYDYNKNSHHLQIRNYTHGQPLNPQLKAKNRKYSAYQKLLFEHIRKIRNT